MYILCGSCSDCELYTSTAAPVQNNYHEHIRIEVICGNNDVTFEWQILSPDILVFQLGYECTDPDGNTVRVLLTIIYNLLQNWEQSNTLPVS